MAADLLRGAAGFHGLAGRNRLAIVAQLTSGERRVVDLTGALGLAQGRVVGAPGVPAGLRPGRWVAEGHRSSVQERRSIFSSEFSLRSRGSSPRSVSFRAPSPASWRDGRDGRDLWSLTHRPTVFAFSAELARHHSHRTTGVDHQLHILVLVLRSELPTLSAQGSYGLGGGRGSEPNTRCARLSSARSSAGPTSSTTMPSAPTDSAMPAKLSLSHSTAMKRRL